jgi:hypothetical protein
VAVVIDFAVVRVDVINTPISGVSRLFLPDFPYRVSRTRKVKYISIRDPWMFGTIPD